MNSLLTKTFRSEGEKKQKPLRVKSISAANTTEQEWIYVKSPPTHAENTSRAGKVLNRVTNEFLNM